MKVLALIQTSVNAMFSIQPPFSGGLFIYNFPPIAV